jgi:SAM-dependent methyltransferase
MSDLANALRDHITPSDCHLGRKPSPAGMRGELTVGVYDEHVLPRLVDLTLGRPFEKTRARVAAGLTGEILEVGFGSGRNVPHYPSEVTRVLAVEPAAAGRRLAAERVAASKVPVEFVGLDGQNLPLADESVDHVLVTWTLCTIPDVKRALAEVRRVLRPGGNLHFVEHGRSPRPRIARWQDRVTPTWGKVAGGCHLNRSIPDLIAGSDLTVTRLDAYRMSGLELFGFMFEGAAVKTPRAAP